MIRRPPRSTRTDTLFPSRRSSDLKVSGSVSSRISFSSGLHITAKLPGSRPGEASALPLSRSEEHTSELQTLMRNSYAVFCLKKKKIEIEHSILLRQISTVYYYTVSGHNSRNTKQSTRLLKD